MDDAKVNLIVLGFSFNQTRTGTYGLVLGEEDGIRRLVVVVGAAEAQSIAFKLQQTAPPRPLAHDLLHTVLADYEIVLEEVIIYEYENGVFFSHLVLNQFGHIKIVDSRTSDAVALALRTGSPIRTTETIMQQLGMVFQETDEGEKERYSDLVQVDNEKINEGAYESLSKEELELRLENAIEAEDYELASVLRDELRKKLNKSEEK